MKLEQWVVAGILSAAICAPAAAQMGAMGGGGAPQGMAGGLVIEIPEGETMVVPLPDGWMAYSREAEEKVERYVIPRGQELTDWREALRQETYRTTVGITAAERVYELRTAADPDNCESFASETLGEGLENGYSMVLWRQVCEFADGQTLASLNKTVLGNDQLHILSMIWKQDPPNRAWNQWTNYMNRVYVCDTNRREEHPCRAGPAARPGGMRR
ncbi:MAG: hypothetical protein OXQ29_23100 [Rhodospirillaceae bacterium]|nr:hypothetical protein [Rhodospirillaceae bacterium]